MQSGDVAADRLQAAVDGWGIGVGEWRHHERSVWGSQRFFELYGWSGHEPMPLEAFWSALHAGDRDAARAAFEGAVQPTGDGQIDLVHRVVHPCGKLLWLHLRGQTAFEGQERERSARSIALSIMDVTAREHAEHELRRTQARFDEAVRSAQFGIFEHNHLDDPLAENVYWSPRLREIFGVDAAVPGSACLLLSRVPVEDIELLHHAATRAHDPQGDGFYDVEHRYLHPTLGMRWLQTRSSTYFAELEGRRIPVRTVGAMMDITRERQLEDDMRQAQKMEAVGRLAGGIAHDFNNILSAILSFAHVAADEVGEAGRGYSELQEIVIAGKRAAALTQQLLTFSRKQVLRPRVVDVGDVLERMAPLLRRLVGEHIELRFSVERSPLRVKLDPSHLEQVLLNLAINARDAMEGGGRLGIESSTVMVAEPLCAAPHGLAPGEYVVIGVSDSGVGMDAQTLAHVFEPFFTTKGAGRGTGLGLATVFGIVKQSGGSVLVDSEPGRGSTFRAYFPRTHEPPVTRREMPRPTLSSGGGVILVVEDDPSVRLVATTVLARAGYTTLSAPGPVEALEMARLRSTPIDLLLTDVVMPGHSGRELAERLSSLHPRLAVIYMSGYTDDDFVHRRVLEEGVWFLPKPLTPDRLLDAVARVLGRVAPAPSTTWDGASCWSPVAP